VAPKLVRWLGICSNLDLNWRISQYVLHGSGQGVPPVYLIKGPIKTSKRVFEILEASRPSGARWR